jgi:hypothetical protein
VWHVLLLLLLLHQQLVQAAGAIAAGLPLLRRCLGQVLLLGRA